ncbi:MAG: tail fiber domain-containing protein [Lachnospiraceae bacterium]|jgi:hypothetical protein|nr:tail fiber domain-containing protein [Lachnospiraceae bacterium]
MVKFKLAEVVELFEDKTAQIQFLGEEVPSEKEYPYLASYAPVVGDKVFLAPLAESYVIIGKMLYMEPPGSGEGGYITTENLLMMLSNYAEINHTHNQYAAAGHSHNGYATSNHEHSEYSRTGHTHDYAAKNHTHDYAAKNHTHNYASSSHIHDRLVFSANASNYYVRMDTTGSFCGSQNGSITLGRSGALWKQVFASNTAISTSDRELKKNINPLDERYEKLFCGLKPVAYQYKKNDSNRVHTGFIAQDVLTAMEAAGIDSQEFAAYIKMSVYKQNKAGENTEELDHIEYGLRYEELIALNTWMIQKLLNRIEVLEEK